MEKSPTNEQNTFVTLIVNFNSRAQAATQSNYNFRAILEPLMSLSSQSTVNTVIRFTKQINYIQLNPHINTIFDAFIRSPFTSSLIKTFAGSVKAGTVEIINQQDNLVQIINVLNSKISLDASASCLMPLNILQLYENWLHKQIDPFHIEAVFDVMESLKAPFLQLQGEFEHEMSQINYGIMMVKSGSDKIVDIATKINRMELTDSQVTDLSITLNNIKSNQILIMTNLQKASETLTNFYAKRNSLVEYLLENNKEESLDSICSSISHMNIG